MTRKCFTAPHTCTGTGLFKPRRAIVFLRVAVLAAVVLNDLEYVFQAHDRHGLDIACLAESGAG